MTRATRPLFDESSTLIALAIGTTLVISACGNGTETSPSPSGAGGASFGGYMSSAGSGGAPAAGGVGGALATGTGGIVNVPAGQLMCAGKQCHGGGHCAADGRCPSFLGDCFTQAAHIDNCDAFCTGHGFTCAEKSCNVDGSGTKPGLGFSVVSYPASQSAECAASTPTTQQTETQDSCATPIWLSPSKPADDIVRCCCQD